MDWKPIETAPKDGTYCLFYSPGNPKASNKNASLPYYKVDWFTGAYPDGYYQYPEARYTHWMPIPKAPA